MKKFLAILIALGMVVCCFAACGGNTNADNTEAPSEEATSEEATSEEATDTVENAVIELGNSGLTIAPEKKYAKGELTEEDTDENQVAYYASEETLVDFDVYEWAKADGETLETAANEEAAEYEATAEMTEINGFAVASYTATEESEGTEYKTATYMIDNGDEFVEIVFWLDGETAEAEVEAILATLTKTAAEGNDAVADVIELGNSGLTIAPEKKYAKGELTEEDTDENQVAYYASEETLVDFDVYEWAKADGETLETAANEEAAEYEATAEMTEINGFAVASYTATEESEGTEYKTATYMIDNGDEFVEIVFWLDGETAEAEVAAILATLAK